MGLTAEAFGRMMKALLPPGRAWRLKASGVLSKALLGASDELVRVDGRSVDLLVESDPRTADELLPEFESNLDLPSDGTLDERRNRVVAHLVTLQRRRPEDYQRMLAPLFGMEDFEIPIIERHRVFAVLVGADEEIYRFFAYRDPYLAGTYDIESAQALIDKVQDAHTLGYAIESIEFLCDDQFSLCDRDLIGVSPVDVANCVLWARADQFVTQVAGAKVSAWGDFSGFAHDLAQTTDGNRLTFVSSVIGRRPALRAGPTAGDKFMSWTPWLSAGAMTIYMVIRFRASASQYQNALFLESGLSGPYLGGVSSNANKPFVYVAAERGIQPTALVDDTPHLVKWAWDDSTETIYTQVDAATEVLEVAPAFTASNKSFHTLGMDPAVDTSQDLVSDIAEIFMYSRRLTGTEEGRLRAYVAGRYGIVM